MSAWLDALLYRDVGGLLAEMSIRQLHRKGLSQSSRGQFCAIRGLQGCLRQLFAVQTHNME